MTDDARGISRCIASAIPTGGVRRVQTPSERKRTAGTLHCAGAARSLSAPSAGELKRVHLELGGKAPVIVLDDADPAAVAAGLRIGSFTNSGQDCTAASRVLAGPKIHGALLAELVPAASSLKVGDPAQGELIEMAPVISARQQERVLGFLDRAAGNGAEVLTGGWAGADGGFFVQPTVIAGAG
jgi:acyl-CoA reductase-like NAD-dependent aldehyde dehydrogenase